MSMGMCDILALSFLIFPLLSFRRSDLDTTYYILYIDGSSAVDRISPNCSFPQVNK